MFPERWSYQLYYRYENGSAGILFFSTCYESKEALEADFDSGIPVSNPSNPVIQDAIEAFAIVGAIEEVEES